MITHNYLVCILVQLMIGQRDHVGRTRTICQFRHILRKTDSVHVYAIGYSSRRRMDGCGRRNATRARWRYGGMARDAREIIRVVAVGR